MNCVVPPQELNKKEKENSYFEINKEKDYDDETNITVYK